MYSFTLIICLIIMFLCFEGFKPMCNISTENVSTVSRGYMVKGKQLG